LDLLLLGLLDTPDQVLRWVNRESDHYDLVVIGAAGESAAQMAANLVIGGVGRNATPSEGGGHERRRTDENLRRPPHI
jgi:hypothetical protein